MTSRTFQEYLATSFAQGKIDHALRVVAAPEGAGAEFYIHPAQAEGETLQLVASGNVLGDPRPAAESELVLARFRWEVKRMGNVEGMFVTSKAKLESAYGKYVDFGEILGKHSSIGGILDRGDITVVNDDQVFLNQLVAIAGWDLGGHNPLGYLQ